MTETTATYGNAGRNIVRAGVQQQLIEREDILPSSAIHHFVAGQEYNIPRV